MHSDSGPGPLRRRAAVYGGANADVQARCYGPYAARDSNPGSSNVSAGGVGRNIAENLARLGVETELVTVFGGDAMSGFLKDSCRAAGVGYGSSLELAGEETPRYVCLLDADGSLVGAVAAMDALDRFTPEELALRSGPGDGADVVVLDANLPEATIVAAARRWKDKILVLDTVSAAKTVRASSVAGLFSIVKPNRREARLLAGLPAVDGDGGPREALEAARALLELGVREAFVSLGGRGLLWASAAGSGVVGLPDLPVVNVSGAGDAATAALAWAAVNGYNSEEKAALAIAAASLCASEPQAVCPRMGADIVTRLAQGVPHERLY